MILLSRFRNGLDLKTFKSHKYVSCAFLIISATLGFTYGSILNGLLTKNSPDVVMLYIKAVETTLLFLFSCILSKAFTIKKLLAVILILIGSYLY